MTLRFSRSYQRLTIDGSDLTFTATNDVRNELNGLRHLHNAKEVIKSVVGGQWGPPYMPRQFPLGTWNVLRVENPSDGPFWPTKIITDAHQKVNVWAIDSQGGYANRTEATVEDSGYHLHWTPSNTTHGCIRIGKDTPDEVRCLGDAVAKALGDGEKVQVVVEE